MQQNKLDMATWKDISGICQWYVLILEMFMFCCAPDSLLGPCHCHCQALWTHPTCRLVLGKGHAMLQHCLTEFFKNVFCRNQR